VNKLFFLANYTTPYKPINHFGKIEYPALFLYRTKTWHVTTL